MKNRFAHEISITRHFMDEIESYLERNEAKQLEEMTEQFYVLKQETEKQIKQLNEELSEARLKVSQMAMEKGKLLKEMDENKSELDIACQALHQQRDNLATKCEKKNPDSRVVAFGEIYTGRLAHETLNRIPIAVKRRHDRYLAEIAEPDATGMP